jgi:hypothetical protein
MAYSGSTASTPNPPVLVASAMTKGTTALTGQSKQLWMYNSTNLTTDLTAAGFFSDGAALGMKAGDLVLGTQYTSAGSSVISFQGVIASISTAGAAAFSTGGLMTSTFS